MSSKKSKLIIPNLPEITITQSNEFTKRKNPRVNVAKGQPSRSKQLQSVPTKKATAEYTSSILRIPETKAVEIQCREKEKNNKRSKIQSPRKTLDFKLVANIRYD